MIHTGPAQGVIIICPHRHPHHDESQRRLWQHPESILTVVGLLPGETFIDIGCGDGFFALPAARMVGPLGSVYGIDIDADALDLLRQKAFHEGIDNILLQHGMAEEVVVCRNCADVVFFGIDLHDFSDPGRVLANARRMVKPSGVVVDVDWKKEPLPVGPPEKKKFAPEYASSLMEEAGLVVERVEESGVYHYMIVARPER